MGVRFFLSRVWLQTELDYTKSYYQFILKFTISVKRKIASQGMKEREKLQNGLIGWFKL